MTTTTEVSKALAALRLTTARLGVSMPPAPAALQGKLGATDDACFTTRELPAPLYDAGVFVDEYFSGAAPDYLAIGIDGYGMMNFYFHYYLVFGDFAVFLQSRLVESKGMDKPVARLNAQIDCVARALDAPARRPGAVVDVIGAQYVADGPARADGPDVKQVSDPLEYYLSRPGGRAQQTAMLHG